MKLRKLVDAIPAINKIAGQDLSIKNLYKVRRLLDKIKLHLEFYDEQRTKILEACGKIENNSFVCTRGNESELEERMKKLLDIEIDENISIVKIPSDEDIKLSYRDICTLEGIIEIDFTNESVGDE